MERIINLTQHTATHEQIAAGVVDLPTEALKELTALLNFTDLPSAEEIKNRAAKIADLAVQAKANTAMIGGALWLMAPLTRELTERGIKAVFAFSRREVIEEAQSDGSVKKVAVFRHEGFVEGV